MRITQVRAIIVVGVLAVVAIATSWFAIANDTQTAQGDDCPPGSVPVSLKLAEEEDVAVRVLNATDNAGLADQASAQLTDYGFEVIETGNSDKEELEAQVEIHFGPDTVADAHLLRSYFADSARFFSLEYEEDYVEVILGPGFQQLNTKSDARNALSVIGWPEAPEGTCPMKE
ncbi:LytR cell envelope-related transcriptional attenuator [Stackebrandtia albiflava]|uniref:LytR cell envelope-related transcriptional attenuator n=1 Tax=Stackebrandtia albiflava TaxID=406432 RepID=A0A562VBD6_9ACTN|nr:LytR C-terminal domain-containing protein [Stackebrandtia albiflava]TWJ15193.1 LytR cell envelope-related transcriptional attenuator [Stackebrandtia albiflava]